MPVSNKRSTRDAPRRPAAQPPPGGWHPVLRHSPRPGPRRRWEPLTGPLTFSLGGSAGAPAIKPGAVEGHPQVEAWKNTFYVVLVRRRDDGSPESLEIMPSLTAPPAPPGHLWKDFQRIKDQLAGPETEAAELYPARSRLIEPPGIDAYFLWCLPPGAEYPFGVRDDNLGVR